MNTTINVLGRQIEVRVVPSTHMANIHAKEKDVWGLFVPEENRIYLSRAMGPETMKGVLLHEVAHAFFYISGFSNLLDEKIEEGLCDLFVNYLPLFRDKKLLDYLK